MEVGECKRGEKNFPKKLLDRRVKPPVASLWYRGELSEQIFAKCAAVVGSRRMSRYGRQAVGEIVPRLTAAGYTIVSGLMYGVDQLAHKVCLQSGGRAIGVLGYGIMYKSEEGAMKLAEEIVASGGLVISEYEGASVSQRWMFPQRNRVVVALSNLVVVVEAGLKSGSLGTARLAGKMGKVVYAVPGPIFAPTSEGTNWLIGEKIAQPLTLPKLTELTGVEREKRGETAQTKLTAGEREIYTFLKIEGPSSTNEIARTLNLPTREVLTQLSQMELSGAVGEERGVWRVA